MLNLSEVERTRIYSFLAYNYDSIFTDDMMDAKYWVNVAFQETSQATVIYCAIDFITNSLHKFYDEECVSNIISRIKDNGSCHFWNLLKKMTQMVI